MFWFSVRQGLSEIALAAVRNVTPDARPGCPVISAVRFAAFAMTALMTTQQQVGYFSPACIYSGFMNVSFQCFCQYSYSKGHSSFWLFHEPAHDLKTFIACVNLFGIRGVRCDCTGKLCVRVHGLPLQWPVHIPDRESGRRQQPCCRPSSSRYCRSYP